MHIEILVLILIVVLIVFAVKEKVEQKIKATPFYEMPEEAKSSPVSQALTELVAIAGGIYVALLLITTFLGLELPPKVRIISIEFDTIAGIALFLAVVQPFILKILKFIKGG